MYQGFYLRMDEDLHDEMKNIAKQNRISTTGLYRLVVENFVKKYNGKNKNYGLDRIL